MVSFTNSCVQSELSDRRHSGTNTYMHGPQFLGPFVQHHGKDHLVFLMHRSKRINGTFSDRDAIGAGQTGPLFSIHEGAMALPLPVLVKTLS